MKNLIVSPSPTGLLMVANVRQCTGSRAPAIMSALGVTEWYNSMSTKKTDNKLVLNTYPLAFVKEAASKLGASFYESLARPQKTLERHKLFDSSQRGAMMPFTSTFGWFSRINAMPIDQRTNAQDHPAVKTWTIKQSGSVEIKQAGIVASTETSNPHNESPMIIDIVACEKTPLECRFCDWAKTLPDGSCAYAVSLLQDTFMQHGLILQGPRKRWSLTQRLAKVGSFALTEIDIPPTSAVDWLVW